MYMSLAEMMRSTNAAEVRNVGGVMVCMVCLVVST